MNSESISNLNKKPPVIKPNENSIDLSGSLSNETKNIENKVDNNNIKNVKESGKQQDIEANKQPKNQLNQSKDVPKKPPKSIERLKYKPIFIGSIITFSVMALIALVLTLCLVLIKSENKDNSIALTTSNQTTTKLTTITTIVTKSNNSASNNSTTSITASENPSTTVTKTTSKNPLTTKSNDSTTNTCFGYAISNCNLKCGENFLYTKIVGGEEAVPNSWPSTVLIDVYYDIYDENYNYYSTENFGSCGGSLIDEYTVLSVAHCFTHNIFFEYQNITFQAILNYANANLGVHTINTTAGSMYTVKSSEIITHEDYNSSNLLNDIALIKLSEKVKLSDKIQIACLPSDTTNIEPNTDSIAVGWGTTSYYESQLSLVLLQVNLTIYDFNYCNNTNPQYEKNSNTQICAGDLSGSKDTCLGDLGGPLFIKQSVNNVTKMVLVGLTSYRYQCAVKNKPGLYTRTTAYLSWILNKIFPKTTTSITASENPSTTVTKTTSKNPLTTKSNDSTTNTCFGYAISNCNLKCGENFLYTKIVGGEEAVPNSWPSTVFIVIFYDVYDQNNNNLGTNVFSCGGSLIDEYTVLTAAHCLNDFYDSSRNFYKLSYTDVYLGAHNISSETSKIQSSKIIVHQEYNDINYLNDIALIKLSEKVKLSDKIQIACLPSDTTIIESNTDSIAVGWGTTSYLGQGSSVLLQVNLTIYDFSFCDNTFLNAPKNSSTQICAGDIAGNKDTCQGDSGGPLFIKQTVNNVTKMVVAGLTSYGVNGCAVKDSPGIYTRTSAYLSWILNNI